MFIQIFKKSENQTETTFKIIGAENKVIGNSIQQLTDKVTTKNRAFYKAIREKMEDFGKGTYFAAQISNRYVFAFIDSSWKNIKVIHKTGKSYCTQEFALTRRTDKTWIFEVDTMTDTPICAEAKEIVYSTETDLTTLTPAELIAIINSQAKVIKAQAEIIETKTEENELFKEEVELVKEEVVKVNKRRAWNANHARNVSRKLNANFAMLRRGVNPLDMLNASADLDIVTKLDNDINYL